MKQENFQATICQQYTNCAQYTGHACQGSGPHKQISLKIRTCFCQHADLGHSIL